MVGARNFGASSPSINLSIGGLGADTFADFTVLAVVQRTTNAAIHCIFSWLNSGGTTIGHLGVMNTDNMLTNCQGTAFDATGPTVQIADGWCLLGWTHVTGNVPVRYHKIPLATLTPTHTTSITNFTSWTAPTGGSLKIGNDSFNEPWAGDIAAVGYWRRALSDVEIESCAISLSNWLSTSGITGFWPLDQAATTTPVSDLIGTANETSLTATTVSGSSAPIGGYVATSIVTATIDTRTVARSVMRLR